MIVLLISIKYKNNNKNKILFLKRVIKVMAIFFVTALNPLQKKFNKNFYKQINIKLTSFFL